MPGHEGGHARCDEGAEGHELGGGEGGVGFVDEREGEVRVDVRVAVPGEVFPA